MQTSRTATSFLAALVLAAGAAGCGTDDAVERDVRDATEEVEREADQVGDDVERALPGDADDDGRDGWLDDEWLRRRRVGRLWLVVVWC